MEDMFCAERSRAVGEGLWGTAVAHVGLWIALEVREPWERDALEHAPIGPRAATRLAQLKEEHPGLRIQVIRRPEQKTGDPALFVSRAVRGQPSCWRIPITGYDDIATLNWEGWARGEVGWSAWRHTRPLYLVCVHGRRDRCCAQRGMPVYCALRAHAPERVWQTSHLGGHRFAATMLTLPDGLCYGRLEPEHMTAFFQARENGEIFDVDHLRGRCSMASMAQAAECAVLRHTGRRSVESLRLQELSEDDDGLLHVTLRDVAGSRYLAQLRRGQVGSAPPSCGAEPAPAYRYEVHAVRHLAGG